MRRRLRIGSDTRHSCGKEVDKRDVNPRNAFTVHTFPDPHVIEFGSDLAQEEIAMGGEEGCTLSFARSSAGYRTGRGAA